MDTKVGVYICKGCDIAKSMDVDKMVEVGTLSKEEIRFLYVADSIEEATATFQDQLVRMWREVNGGQKDVPKWWFLEERQEQKAGGA